MTRPWSQVKASRENAHVHEGNVTVVGEDGEERFDIPAPYPGADSLPHPERPSATYTITIGAIPNLVFCGHCGTKLVDARERTGRYDVLTGEPIEVLHRRCPRATLWRPWERHTR